MLQVNNLLKSYNNLLFKDLSFRLGDREKVGLVGLNGCGKTTLFRIIAGYEEPDRGEVLHEQEIGYLPQEFDLDLDQFVGEYLESIQNQLSIPKYKIDEMMGRLELQDSIDEYQYLNELSDGQRMKLYLIQLILKDENSIQSHIKPILLLDEPTNHLDIDGILWFEKFLRNYEGSAVIISHDRDFLNNTVSKILEMDEQGLIEFEGNYDDYIFGKEAWVEKRAKLYHMQEKKREKLEKLIENSRKISDGKAKSRAIRAAKKRMEREVTRNEVDKYKEVRISGMELGGAVHDKKKMLVLRDLVFGYTSDKDIIDGVDLTIWGKQKVWLYGANGSGKTTLIKLLIGQLKPDGGELKWGENTTFGYFSQDQSHIDMDATVGEYFMRETGVEYGRSFGVLDKFLFDKSYRDQKIGLLSPGQRARLSFAIFSQGKRDFLILDEPTNHLDIKTKELIERSLNDYEGNVLLISHDRYFVEQVSPDRAITIVDGKLVEGS